MEEIYSAANNNKYKDIGKYTRRNEARPTLGSLLPVSISISLNETIFFFREDMPKRV